MNSFSEKFKPILDDGEMLWSLCFKHNDIHRPNLSLTYTGRYKGCYKCWACSFAGKVTESTLKEILKKYNMGKRKPIYKKSIDYLQQWLKSRENLFFVDCDILDKLLGITSPLNSSIWGVVNQLQAGWCKGSLLFPMYNADLQIIGIHKRPEKRNLKGSTLGIFAPKDIVIKDTLFITEGVTDLICLMLMGYTSIGRTSANSCNKIIFDLLKDKKCSIIYIVADNDGVGIDGANKLADELTTNKRDVLIILPPQNYKDLKEFVNDKGLEYVRRFINDRFRI